MARADESIVWTGRQLTTQWLLTPDHAAPKAFALCRQTLDHRGEAAVAYHVHGRNGPMAPDEWRGWLISHDMCGEQQLDVSLLIISETLDPSGVVRECALERRRADVDGPFSGRPARIEFLGAARAVRLYEVDAHQRLIELPPEQELAESTATDVLLDGEEAAIRAHLGAGVAVLCRRTPLLAESAAGFGAIFHLDRDGDALACGLGWHGPQAYVIVADFPRMSQPLALPPESERAVHSVLQMNGLVRRETRLDAEGLVVMATDPSARTIYAVRPMEDRAVVTPYRPSPEPGSEDQHRWIRFVETHQGASLLDAYADGLSDVLIVLMADAAGRVWRHRIDADGLELDRELADGTAAAQRYHSTRPDEMAPVSSPSVTRGQPVRALTAGLDAGAHLARPGTSMAPAASAGAMPGVPPPRLNNVLPGLERLLHDATERTPDPAPLGAGGGIRFALASHHLAEATRCLEGRLPAAAVFHAMAAARAGLVAMDIVTGRDTVQGHDWTTILRAAVASPTLPHAARQALLNVERAWLLAGADSVDKYTEREAETLAGAVDVLIRRLAEA